MAVFETFEKPCLTAFSDSDPVTKGGEIRFKDSVPSAVNQKQTIVKGAGHFLLDDASELIGHYMEHIYLAQLKRVNHPVFHERAVADALDVLGLQE